MDTQVGKRTFVSPHNVRIRAPATFFAASGVSLVEGLHMCSVACCQTLHKYRLTGRRRVNVSSTSVLVNVT